jgi:hypothetical protein
MRAMSSKVCKTCGTCKPLSEFYTHNKMADGYLNKCKECVKKRVAAHRDINIEKIRAYDRIRGKLPARVDRAREYIKAHPEKATEYSTRFRLSNPEKYAAHIALNNALRDGKLTKPELCESCGKRNRLHGHHDDYSRPLSVVWLCPACHKARHLRLQEQLKGANCGGLHDHHYARHS